jgi:hypothetical protein
MGGAKGGHHSIAAEVILNILTIWALTASNDMLARLRVSISGQLRFLFCSGVSSRRGGS